MNIWPVHPHELGPELHGYRMGLCRFGLLVRQPILVSRHAVLGLGVCASQNQTWIVWEPVW